jgi:hypothetical protein
MEPTPDETKGASRPRKRPRKQAVAPPSLLGAGFGPHTFRIESRETRLEIAARLNAEKAKLEHDLRKDFALFLGVIAIVVVATGACLFIVLSNRYLPAVQNSAMALLAVIVSGGVGYATGKSSK